MQQRDELKRSVFMEIAFQIARLSRCDRARVGACLVKEDRIISIGYNGTPNGLNNECEEDGVTKEIVVHAELNAILFAAKKGISTDGCVLYVTMAPCFDCVKTIIQAGIVEVIYCDNYHTTGLAVLEEGGVKVRRYERVN